MPLVPIVRVVGVDENGLGPRLGPLVVTAAVLDLDRYDAQALRAIAEPIGITDSKEVGGFGDMAACEMISDSPSDTSARQRPRMPARSGCRRSTNRWPPRRRCQPSTGNCASDALAMMRS